MKKLLGILVLGFLFCSVGYTKEENKYYLDYLKNCSSSNVEHYILKDDYSPADRHRLDIFESTNLKLDCLEKKFTHHQKNYPVEAWASSSSVPFDEIIIRKQDTVTNEITFNIIVITSLFSQQCGEACKFSDEVILIYEGRYWYMRGANDKGVESKFINKDTILIRNLMTTHVRNYIFDINTKLFTSLPNGGLEFKKDHILVNGQKSYFEGGGAFWFESKRNYSGKIIELISEGNTCEDITRFHETIQKAMKKQKLKEFCVTTY